MKLFPLSLLLLCGANLLPGTTISELFFNPEGTDGPWEYVELAGAANGSIAAGTYLVGVEGDVGAGLGDVQTIFNLGGLTFGSNGYLVLLQNGNTYTVNPNAAVFTGTGTGFSSTRFSADSGTDIENASATWFLIQTATVPTLSTDIDSNNDGLADGAAFAAWTILDSITVLDGNNAGDRGYGAYAFLELGVGAVSSAVTSVNVGFTPAYVARLGAGNGVGAWMAADSDGSGPGFVFEPVDITVARLANQPLSVMDLGGPNPADVPEPTSLWLTMLGLAALTAIRKGR